MVFRAPLPYWGFSFCEPPFGPIGSQRQIYTHRSQHEAFVYHADLTMNGQRQLVDGRAVGGIPALVFVVWLAAGLIINVVLRLGICSSPWNFIVGGILVIPAAWLSVYASYAFKRHNTPTEPWKRASQLVQDGPYRFTRNPIYLSFAIAYVGLAFVFNSLPALVLLIPLIIVLDRTQIIREERYLEGMFGEEYFRYKERVRRWI